MNIKEIIKKKFVTDFIWNIISFGFVTAGVMILNVVIGNYYNAEGLGIFNYTFSLYTVLSALTVFGIKGSLIKYVAENKNNQIEIDKSISTGILIVLSTSILFTGLFALLNLIITINPDIYSGLYTYMFVALPIFSINEVFMGIINGLRRMREYAIFRSIRWVLILFFILTLVFFEGPVEYTLFSFLFTEYLMLVGLLYITRDTFKFTSIDYNWVKKHANFGIKTTLTQVVNQLDTRLPTLLLGFYVGNQALGVFTFASTVMSGLIMIPSVITIVFNPIVSSLWKEDKEKLKNHLKTLKKSVYLITIPSLIIAAMLFPSFVSIFMHGEVYKSTIPIFYVLLIGTSVLSLVVWKAGILPMIGRPGKQLKIKLAGLIVNLILNVVLIYYYDVLGAAYATTTSNIVYAIMLSYSVKKEVNSVNS